MTLKRVLPVFFIGAVLLAGLIYFLFENRHRDTVYPRISALGVNLGSLSRDEAEQALEQIARGLEDKEVILEKNGKIITASLSDMGIHIDTKRMAQVAFQAGRNESRAGNALAIIENTVYGFRTPTYYRVDEKKTSEFILSRLENINEAPRSSEVIYTNGNYQVTPSRIGKGVDTVLLAASVIDYMNDPHANERIHVTEETAKKPEVAEPQADRARIAANELINKLPELRAADKKWLIDRDTIASFIKFEKVPQYRFRGVESSALENDILAYSYSALTGTVPESTVVSYQLDTILDKDKIKDYLTTIAPGVEQSAVNARLAYEEGQLKIVNNGQDKISLDMDGSIESLSTGIRAKQDFVELKTIRQKAPVSQDNLDALGIKTLVGQGVSNFAGSPKNRKHNLTVGASKFDGILIKPGEVFSFLNTLGPVDASTGYLPELVIKEDKTIPEYGGGMCQVSTTSFRAAINTGLEVVERRNHAYPVQYYSPQGTDATVYIPSPDLKFKNNTPGHILIQTHIEGNILTFDYYGTSDGRRVETVGPVIYDRQGDGSMKASWTQRVFDSLNNLMHEKTFLSKYDSPSKYPHPGEEPPKETKKKKKKH